MTKRRLIVGVRSEAEARKSLREAFRRVGRGDLTPRDPELYFETAEQLRHFLTEKRMELTLAIVRERPASVRELAKIVKRDYKNVATDIALLERLGLVKLRGGKGRAQAPTVPYDEIRITIDLHRPRQSHAA